LGKKTPEKKLWTMVRYHPAKLFRFAQKFDQKRKLQRGGDPGPTPGQRIKIKMGGKNEKAGISNP